MYAAVVRGLTHDSQVAYAFSTLAIDLDRKMYGRVSAPVAFLHAWFINHWINPVKTNPGFAREGARVGLQENDVLYGCFNAAAHVMYLNFSGAPLQQVVQEADRQMSHIAGRVRVAAFHCLLERQLALALLGRTEHRLSLSDEQATTKSATSPPSAAPRTTTRSATTAWPRCGCTTTTETTRPRCVIAEQALPILPAFQGQVGEWEFVFYRALATLARAQEVGDAEREPLLRAGEELLAQFEGWASVAASNFAHKRDLIRAELQRARQDHDAAVAAYEAAVASATASGFVHDLALAHERAALFHHAAGDEDKARMHFQAALNAYESWEAWAKSAAIRENFLAPKTAGVSRKVFAREG